MDDEISLITGALKSFIKSSGGDSTLKDLEDALFKNYGPIDFKRHGANNGLLDFIRIFPDRFSVSQSNCVSLVSPENPTPKPSNLQVSSSINVMDRFLADCAEEFKNATLNHKDDSTSEIQATLNCNLDDELQKMTLMEVQSIFKETNPFLEDVLQEYTQITEFDALGEFYSALNVESFLEDPIKCGESKEALSIVTVYKEIQSPMVYEKIQEKVPSENFSDKDFEQLEKLRDEAVAVEMPSKLEIVKNAQRKKDSLDSLSSHDINEKPRKPEIRKEREVIENSKERVMLLDDPAFYKHLPPHNRDQNLKLPEAQKLGEKMEIMISHFDSPIHFWFQLADEKRTLREIQERLDDFYLNLKEDDLKIARKNVKEGLIVAAFHAHFKEWYRARITKIEKDTVFVLYLDYGTCENIEFCNLRYLVKDLLSCPPLCYRGRTYGIMPLNNDGFSTAHREQFGVWVTQKFMNAECKYYDEELDTYELQMTFRDGRELKDLILTHKIGKELPGRFLNNRALATMRPYFYELPTHELLEDGEFPTYESIYQHETNGYYMNTLIKTNYLLNSKKKTPAMLEMLEKADDFRIAKKYYSS